MKQRNISERRAYAAQRAVIAVDRAIDITSKGPFENTEQALRWMKLWMAFAASRPISTLTYATAKAA